MAQLTVTTNKSEVVEVFLPDDWNLDMPYARASFIEEVLEAINKAQAIDDKGGG